MKAATGYKFSKIIFSEQQIQDRIKEIGAQITKDYADKQDDGIVIVGVLRGACIFMSDLIRQIDLKVKIDFITASSYYNDSKSCGDPKIDKDITESIVNKHLILVEDIVDTGLTLECLSKLFADKGAASVNICALLDKHKSKADINVGYTCFDCPEEFIVGYGLDYAQEFRNLPYITSLENQIED